MACYVGLRIKGDRALCFRLLEHSGGGRLPTDHLTSCPKGARDFRSFSEQCTRCTPVGTLSNEVGLDVTCLIWQAVNV